MTRVRYGIAFLAFQSIRPLQVLAEESDDDLFRIATLNDMFVDELLTGVTTLRTIKYLKKDSYIFYFAR